MNPRTLLEGVGRALNRGSRHRRRLETVENTVVVSGIRGKTAAVRWLYEVLYSRDQDVLGKITGNRPMMLYDGQAHPIERGRRVTLYENEQQLRRFAPVETLILENQAIGEYTTRLVNERFANPDVVFVTNVRRDHLDGLGRNPLTIARALARTIPAGTTLVSGEQHPVIRQVLEEEVRDTVTIRHVSVPEEFATVPAIETILGLNEVLDALSFATLSEEQLAAYIDEMDVTWTHLPEGRVYNAASVNDVDSTEIVRQALTGGHEQVQPMVYLRDDRRARTVSFLAYLDQLYDRNGFELARAVGPHAELFARHASFPVATHHADEDAASVLDEMLSLDWPVFIIGNTVASFMRDLEAEIDDRRLEPGRHDGERRQRMTNGSLRSHPTANGETTAAETNRQPSQIREESDPDSNDDR